ncbi:hypothetical protein PM10SUCC1_07320 [Propionigenium maris DSM 9537]|uniref:Uncharacterized protein n=1 Tax=Propionigenium maris DSM 9537 TaxID=1123000 RepID=A0A9W6LM17_9FUSO|nr:hypothetical protein [Propionigenium maris]GLI55217.1 hypothetical protein PM10SUCC1_07320 [Propionigenium maris DSM 9537]
MRNQTTPNDAKYREAKEDITKQIFTEGNEVKTIKSGIDLFIFALVLPLLLVDLIVISNEPLIKGSAILSFIVEYIPTVFVILIADRARKDPDYNGVYFLLGAFSSLTVEGITSILIDNYLSITTLYTDTIVKGIITAFVWGYFYRSFKIYSMKKLFE